MSKKRSRTSLGAGVIDDYIKIYGFVNDTAFYNREFSVPASTIDVDQGACCLSQKVNSMFGNPTVIQDAREHRVPTNEMFLSGSSYEETELKRRLMTGGTYLKGKMDIVFDPDHIDSSIREETVSALQKNSDVMKNLFSFLEIIGNYQVFENDITRATIDISAAIEKASIYKEAAGKAEVDLDQTGTTSFVECEHIYHTALDLPEFNIRRFVRNYVVVRFNAKTSKDVDLPIELHLWWGESRFLAEYPLCTITDSVLPCEPQYLYDLLDHFKTVSQFTEETSRYVRDRMNTIVSKNDHTGVANFQTNYYAYPDTQPTNTFLMTFGVVYKGHAPTIDQIKDYLRKEILDINPKHDEEEWRKKLPGLMAERRFFLIPIYDNIWESDEVEHRSGIYDITRNSTIVLSILGSAYREQIAYLQYVAPKYSKYPVLAVPHLENPISSKLISLLYPDYIGLRNGEIDPDEGSIEQESEPTKDFTQLFNDALAWAAADQNAGEIDDIKGLSFVHFTPKDGTMYYVLTKHSYREKIK